MTISAIDTVGGFFAAYGAGDLPGAMAFIADDVRWTYHGPADTIPWGGTFIGPEGVAAFFRRFEETAEPIEMTPYSMVEVDGLVYVRGLERSRAKASGREYAVEWVHVIATADGRITRFDEYIDSATVAAAMA